MLDVAKLDSHIRFLTDESHYLRDRHSSSRGLMMKADRFDEIAEFLRRVRQDHQMRGVTGKRIDASQKGPTA